MAEMKNINRQFGYKSFVRWMKRRRECEISKWKSAQKQFEMD